MEEEKRSVNHLGNEKSPYLLQHANNPVDWYPWGDEPFQKARAEDKPIFLSIGYATCHWCHVMEEESFDDDEVARVMNENFICIKVDREERPEVDSIYMDFAQTMIIGSAGWPLNMILTPDLKPFFAATYLPKHNSKGLVGVVELATKIGTLWKGDERDRLIAQADKIVDILKSRAHVHGEELPFQERIADTAEILFRIADPVYGGMKGAPKFPLGYQANFLLRYFLRSQDNRALFLVEKTLEMMHRGGIYDHIGGGFARYSIDEHWEIPHFEKMLYDNALLAGSYLEAWRVTGRDLYRQVCQEILTWVLRDMTAPEGGFYTALDADSNGIEGLYYTWTRDEVESILGQEKAELFCDFYTILEEGNFNGRTVPYMDFSFEEYSQEAGIPQEELESELEEGKKVLFEERKKRPRPFCDDKVVTSWNGLMIRAMCQCGFYLQEKEYLDAALKAATFIKQNLYKDGVLYRRWRQGEVRYRASLDDYAFLISGILSLYEANQGTDWLAWAIELAKIVSEQFKAPVGAFYQTDGVDLDLIIRKCQFSDGAEPSGNAVHAENLLSLYQITGSKDYLDQAEDIFKACNKFIDTYPLGYIYHLLALERYFDAKKATFVISLSDKNEGLNDIIDILSHKVIPHYSVVWRRPELPLTELLTQTYGPLPPADKTVLCLCQEGVCKKPIEGKEEIIKTLRQW